MKRFLPEWVFCLFFLSCVASLQAQVPEGFSFQAVVRDNQGQLAVDRVVNVRLAILQGSDAGTEVYNENHSVRANSHGLVSLVVGEGSAASSDFASIDWSAGPYFLQVEADANGGMDYQLVAVTQLLSVPYALHSISAQALTGTIPFSQITEVPDTLGFSGSWNDLTDKPELFSGSWNDLTDRPEGIEDVFSGRYQDLEGLPILKDTVALYGFSGQYADLEGKPELFSGRYQDLEGRPSFRDSIRVFGFSGRYSDLQGRPSYTRDSVPVWNALLDYRLLRNRPSLESGGFDGDYNDLYNTPDIASIAAQATRVMLDTLSYPALKRLPVFQDSVEKYGFSGRYSDLSGAPDLASMIVNRYDQLGGLPNLRDTVYKYMYVPDTTQTGVSSWNDLTDKPVFRDSVERYGFSGDYADLTGRPQGQAEGDILYWSNEQWTVLPIGEEGQMLTIAGGRLAWVDPSFTSTAANTYKVGEVYNNEKGEPEGIVVEVSSTGRYAKIASLQEYDPAAWALLSSERDSLIGATSKTDGLANTMSIKSQMGWQTEFPVFAAIAALGEGWYVPSESEMALLFSARTLADSQLEKIEGADLLASPLYWTSTELDAAYAAAYLFVDSIFDTEDGSISLSGGQQFESSKTDRYALRPFKQLTWAQATSKPDATKTYRVGDVFINPQTSSPEGIVYKISDGGLHGAVASYQEKNANWAEADAWAHRDGWHLPSTDEMMEVMNQRHVINASMTNYLQGRSDNVPLRDDFYANDSTVQYWVSDAEGDGDGQYQVLYFDSVGLQGRYVPAWDTIVARTRKIKEF